MEYKVILTELAESQLDRILSHVSLAYRNRQIVADVLNNVEEAIGILRERPMIYELCREPELAPHGYYRGRLRHYRYFFLYRIEGEKVYVDRVFHELQDFRESQDEP